MMIIQIKDIFFFWGGGGGGGGGEWGHKSHTVSPFKLQIFIKLFSLIQYIIEKYNVLKYESQPNSN